MNETMVRLYKNILKKNGKYVVRFGCVDIKDNIYRVISIVDYSILQFYSAHEEKEFGSRIGSYFKVEEKVNEINQINSKNIKRAHEIIVEKIKDININITFDPRSLINKTESLETVCLLTPNDMEIK